MRQLARNENLTSVPTVAALFPAVVCVAAAALGGDGWLSRTGPGAR